MIIQRDKKPSVRIFDAPGFCVLKLIFKGYIKI